MITNFNRTTKRNSRYAILWVTFYLGFLFSLVYFIGTEKNLYGYASLAFLFFMMILNIIDNGYDIGWYRRYKDPDYDKKKWTERNKII